jgi:predicted NAD/FAD-binding protein
MNNSDAIYYNNAPITNIIRKTGGVSIKAHGKKEEIFDRILIATHANTALKMINDANSIEKAILGSFKYAKNRAILHSDERFMPKRKRAWSSWNYMQSDSDNDRNLSVTYWMNLLQPLKTDTNLFVTLNPEEEPRADLIHYSKDYEHPIFDLSTLQAQKRMNELMGYRNIWYAGAHFGYGFHEDGLQSGLYAAENLGNIKRPWSLPDMNSRILTAEYNKIPNAQSKNHNQSKEVA